MQSLNHLVSARKALYLGISDTPAWVVTQANAYARQHCLRPFSLYQGRWTAAERDFEREIILMCKSEGMGIAPWGTLGGGTQDVNSAQTMTDRSGTSGYFKSRTPPPKTAAVRSTSTRAKRRPSPSPSTKSPSAMEFRSPVSPWPTCCTKVRLPPSSTFPPSRPTH